MGYSTDFQGQFDFNKPLDDKTYDLLVGLASTRRMIRRVRKEDGYGIDGGFYVGPENGGPKCMNTNRPPRTQPDLWLQWVPTKDRMHLKWDEGEKFYGYVAWLEYLSNRVLRPAGYELNGTVTWIGEDPSDTGTIVAVKGDISVRDATNLARGRAYASPTKSCYAHGGTPENWLPNACFGCKSALSEMEVEHDNDVYYEGGKVEDRPTAYF